MNEPGLEEEDRDHEYQAIEKNESVRQAAR